MGDTTYQPNEVQMDLALKNDLLSRNRDIDGKEPPAEITGAIADLFAARVRLQTTYDPNVVIDSFGLFVSIKALYMGRWLGPIRLAGLDGYIGYTDELKPGKYGLSIKIRIK